VVRRTTVTRRTTYGRDLHREAWIWIKGGGGGEKISFYAEREGSVYERDCPDLQWLYI
jgi:hypothetical protein